MGRICILTADESYDERWEAEAEPIAAALGKNGVIFRSWSKAGDLSKFDLILPLLAWGYHLKAPAWYRALDEWEAAGLPFLNPIPTLRWNTDKDYLIDLQEAGVAIVPTIEVHGIEPEGLAAARKSFGASTLIIKPSISAGANGTYKIGPGDPIPFDVLEREMLIQPMMEAIATEGEFSLFYFGEALSHAVLKKPASGDFRVQPQFGSRVVPVEPSAAALQLAEAALAAVPKGDYAPPLYARVDMVRDGAGAFRLMELELIEPSLFLAHAPDGGKSFGAAVLKRLG